MKLDFIGPRSPSTARPAVQRPLRRTALQAAGVLLCAACYIGLDWASDLYPLGAFNITPWNPPPGLALVWMLLGGLHYALAVFIGALGADILIRDSPGGLALSVLTSTIFACGYSAMAAVLKRLLPSDARLRDTRDLWALVAVTASGSLVVAALYAAALVAGNYLDPAAFLTAVFRSWLGDTVGILVTAPLLLLVASEPERRALKRALRKPETALQLAVMTAMVVVIFWSDPAPPTAHFYLLFVPLVWTSVRNGFVGATLCSGLVQAGVIAAVQLGDLTLSVLELQARVAAFTLTGLFLGILVDERRRTGRALRRTMRLATAGEMAGAIAHEINQPLAALRNYGKACLLLSERHPQPELTAVIEKMQAEAHRAADVVVRLRDFFRSGTSRLERVSAEALLDDVRRVAERMDPQCRVAFTVERHTDAVLLVDRLQIGLVLRNLVHNAFDAVESLPAERRHITVSAFTLPDGRVLFRVADGGPGVPSATREELFEPTTSNKASGMGLGLAISRTIAEAHGGSLSAPALPHGEFHLVLPTTLTDE